MYVEQIAFIVLDGDFTRIQIDEEKLLSWTRYGPGEITALMRTSRATEKLRRQGMLRRVFN